jgi:hypothetical protein
LDGVKSGIDVFLELGREGVVKSAYNFRRVSLRLRVLAPRPFDRMVLHEQVKLGREYLLPHCNRRTRSDFVAPRRLVDYFDILALQVRNDRLLRLETIDVIGNFLARPVLSVVWATWVGQVKCYLFQSFVLVMCDFKYDLMNS